MGKHIKNHWLKSQFIDDVRGEVDEVNVKHKKMPQLLQGLWFTKYKLYEQLMSPVSLFC